MTRKLLVWAHVLGWLQLWCPHLPGWQTADLLEGGADPDVQVHWCRACGAVAVVYNEREPYELRRPDPIDIARGGHA